MKSVINLCVISCLTIIGAKFIQQQKRAKKDKQENLRYYPKQVWTTKL